MKELYILRHSKSSWNTNDEDINRPLNNRGLKEREIICDIFIKENEKLDYVICSSSRRTRQTIEPWISNNLIDKNNVHYTKNLYHSSVKMILDEIVNAKNNINALLIVSHMPLVSQLVEYLTNENLDFATSALVKINLEINNWNEICSNIGMLAYYKKPITI